jgi:hypothetical protein
MPKHNAAPRKKHPKAMVSEEVADSYLGLRTLYNTPPDVENTRAPKR